jgi:hypothetical protein
MGNLQNWPKLVHNFRTAAEKKDEILSLPDMSSLLICGSTEEKCFHVGLQSLVRARIHKIAKDFNKIMYNIEILVFTIWWIAVVRTHWLSTENG